MKYIFKSKSRYKIIYALQTNQIIERIVSLFLQVITITLIGKYSDKNISRSNTLVTVIKSVITGIFLFSKDKITISFNNALSDNFQKVYETSIQTSIQNIIKDSKENNELLSAVGQISLCFTEVFIFGILSIISTFINEDIFYIIFILSIISTITINLNIKKEEKNID